MATEIIMPKAGMDMQEGTIVKWLKKEGDVVEKGEPLLEILTDKVNMEVEAEKSGTLLKIIGKEGEVLPVFTVIGYIGEAGEEIPFVEMENQAINEEDKNKKLNIKPDEIEIIPIVDSSGKVRATPAARRLAKERGIPLEKIDGSGPLGRVQQIDVEEYSKVKVTPLARKIAETENIDLNAVSGTGLNGKITKKDVQDQLKLSSPTKTGKIIPMVGLRKLIAERMKESLEKSAPFTLNTEVDMTRSKQLIEKLRLILQEEKGIKLTITDIIILATTKALLKYPIVNATLVEEGIKINDFVNIGVAVGLEEGLVVPVIEGTHLMSLKEIAEKRADLVNRAINNNLSPDELRGSTFTISNLGMYGITSFNSIINQPNSAILSVGAIIDKVRAVDGEVAVKPVMNLSLTIDHRVADGLRGAEFLDCLKELLEEPDLMLL